jgi:hypothetical protein
MLNDIEISKAKLLELGAYATRRASDNSGTYVENSDGETLCFISNSENIDGIWLYYSGDVRDWLGIKVHRD